MMDEHGLELLRDLVKSMLTYDRNGDAYCRSGGRSCGEEHERDCHVCRALAYLRDQGVEVE